VSRSSPSAPLYLHSAIDAVQGVLTARHPEPLTAAQIAEALRERGFRWPLRDGHDRIAGRWQKRPEYGEPTADRVRRVCQMTGNRTIIQTHDHNERPRRYTIYSWAVEGAQRRPSARRTG
jgi:hypothetical protein